MGFYNYLGNSVKSEYGSFDTVLIAASDSSEIDKAKADYVCTGVNDQNLIQSAIDSFGTKSGIVQLANGTYNIDSFTAYNGFYFGLYLSQTKREIILRGVSHNHKSDNTSFAATGNAAVLKVTQAAYDALPSDTESTVIGGVRTWTFPYKALGVENLSIYLPNNQKPIIGVDGQFMACMHVDGCFFKTDAAYNDDSAVNPKCIAVRGCTQGNIGYNYSISHNKVIGWGTGFQLSGEHLICIDSIAQRTAYGFVFGNAPFLNTIRVTGLHPLTLINCGAEYNSMGAVYFGTGQRNAVSIKEFNMESGIAASATWGSEFLFSADDNCAFFGDITYAVLNNSGWNHVQKNAWDSIAHAKFFKTRDMVAPLSGTTAQRPADPVYLSQYFDTTVGKMMTWNGSEWV